MSRTPVECPTGRQRRPGEITHLDGRLLLQQLLVLVQVILAAAPLASTCDRRGRERMRGRGVNVLCETFS
jgi:hypothetical protein